MSVHGGSTTTISTEGDRIPRKNKQKKFSEILITENKITQKPYNQIKKVKVDSSIDLTKTDV